MNRGLNLPDMPSNAGSYLVVNLMNQVKQRYPFVDLLKPETTAALRLLALIGDESVRASIRKVVEFSVATMRGQRAVAEGRLGSDDTTAAAAQPLPQAELLSLYDEAFADDTFDSGPPTDSSERFLQQAEEDLDRGLSASEMALRDSSPATLGGFTRYLWGWLTGEVPDERIRAAMLDWLQDDHTFAVDEPDDQFRRLADTTSPAVDFLIAGHTHLARALRRESGGYYFNSGTWSQLIALTPVLLGDAARFATVLAAMRAHSMQALKSVPGLLFTRATVVCVRDVGGRAVGSLEEVRELAGDSYELVGAQLPRRDGPPALVTRFVQE